MKVHVRFTGVIELFTKSRDIELEVDNWSSYSDLVEKLAEDYPDLVGVLIDSDGKTLLSSNLFFINGESYIMPGMMDLPLQAGDNITLISPVTGG